MTSSIFNLAELKAKLLELGISPKKSLGQNFLVNQSTSQRIVDRALRFSPSQIVEVGPGLGALTELLLESKVPLQLIELDRKFCEIWRAREVDVIERDALRLDWASLHLKPGAVLVSNLPYQISASLVIDRSVEPAGVAGMVLMFQKEVAQRIQAKTSSPDYGLLSVVAQAFWKVELLLDCGPKDFYPPPNVGSRVLTFARREDAVMHPEKFLKLVKSAFAQRRKLLIKNLEAIKSREALETSFLSLGLSLQARAEELSPSLFEKLHVLLTDKV